MPVDLDQLKPEFKDKVLQLLQKCSGKGITMHPNEGMRTPFQQAKYWRQSRSIEEITAKIAELNTKGAPFLAHCIDSVGPQHGALVTNALPGLSWHQWGEALDCFWLVNGQAEWSETRLVNGLNGFHVYTDLAPGLGLTPGGSWVHLKDWPHVQLNSAANPLDRFTMPQIDQSMKNMFGG